MDFQQDIASAEAPPMLGVKEYEVIVTKPRVDQLPNGASFIMADLVIPAEQFPADFAGAEDYPDGVVIQRALLCEVQDTEGRQTKRHAWNVKQLYLACGIKMPKDNTIDLGKFEGARALCTVGHRDANGDTFYKPGKLRPLS